MKNIFRRTKLQPVKIETEIPIKVVPEQISKEVLNFVLEEVRKIVQEVKSVKSVKPVEELVVDDNTKDVDPIQYMTVSSASMLTDFDLNEAFSKNWELFQILIAPNKMYHHIFKKRW